MAYTIPCKWQSDQCQVVLEMPSETSKACKDAVPCTIRSLLQEFEENEVVDVALHQHSCERPGASDTSGSFYRTSDVLLSLGWKGELQESNHSNKIV